MKKRLSAAFALPAALTFAAPLVSAEQPPTSSTRPGSATAAATSTAPGGHEAARAVKDLIARYRAAGSYQDRLVMRLDIDAEGEAAPPKQEPMEFTLAYARPNRLALRGPQYGVYCDGHTLWEAFVPFEQYIAAPAPERFDIPALQLSSFEAFGQLRQHPLLYLLTAPAGEEVEFLSEIRSWVGVATEGGFQVLTGRVEAENNLGEKSEVPVIVRVSEKTGLLHDIRYDYTEKAQADIARRGLEAQVRVRKYARVAAFEDAKINHEIPGSTFVFKPAQFEEKVDKFRPLSMEEYQHKLVGRPAPDFTEKDLAGKTVSLADLKGRVILLDFWTTWCGPCVMVVPEIQKLAEKYAGKPVSVIGVNGDKAEARPQVERFISDKKLTYQQLLDTDDSTFEAYRAMSIPHLVLIDAGGTVRLIERGITPGVDSGADAMIDKLLKEAATRPATQSAGGPAHPAAAP